MAKIIDFATLKVLADLPCDMPSPKRMTMWEFPDDEHDLQDCVKVIAWDSIEAKDSLDTIEMVYNDLFREVS